MPLTILSCMQSTMYILNIEIQKNVADWPLPVTWISSVSNNETANRQRTIQLPFWMNWHFIIYRQSHNNSIIHPSGERSLKLHYRCTRILLLIKQTNLQKNTLTWSIPSTSMLKLRTSAWANAYFRKTSSSGFLFKKKLCPHRPRLDKLNTYCVISTSLNHGVVTIDSI